MADNLPYSCETLAARWSCSAETVRQLCKTGKLKHFRLQRLYRIPATAVDEYEQQCKASVSDTSAEASASTGRIPGAESGDAISLRHAPDRRRKPKP